MSQLVTKAITDLAITTAKINTAAVTDAKVATGIDAAKIANGSVSNTEFQFLDGVTSSIQTQINNITAGAFAYRSVTGTDTATTADYTLNLSGASFTETLYTAVGNSGKVLVIVHSGTSVTQNYTVTGNSGQTIGGLSNYILYTNGETITIQSNGTNWIVLNHVATTAQSSTTTLTITGTTSNPTKATTQQSDKISWAREGAYAYIPIQYEQDAGTGGAAGSGDYKVLLPGGLVADTTAVPVNTTVDINFPAKGTLDGVISMTNGSSTGVFHARLYDSTHFTLYGLSTGGTDDSWGSGGFALNAQCHVYGWVRIPIQGWNA